MFSVSQQKYLQKHTNVLQLKKLIKFVVEAVNYMKISRKSLIGLSAITSLLVSASAISITNKMRKEPFSLITKSNIDMSFHSSEIDVDKNNSLEQDIEDVLKKSVDELNKILIKMDNELLVACLCLIQFGDGNYTDWNSFVAKFNNNAWKENEKINHLLKIS